MAWTYQLTDLARAIEAGAPGASIEFSSVSTDTRTLEPGQVFFALSGENFDGNRFVGQAFAKGASAAVAKVAHDGGPCLVVADPLKALQQFAACHRARYRLPLLALTGSCGKTTAKDLVAAVLGARYRVVKTQGNLNNEIGCPLSLLQIDEKTEHAVIEMGANHAGEIAGLCEMARPTEAAITMIAAAHLEGFGSVENVAKAKAEIVHAVGAGGTFYVNADDEWCARIAEAFPGKKVRFGGRGDVVLEACRFDESGEMRLRVKPVGELRLPLVCRAHAVHVLLAVAVGLTHGIEEFEGPLRAASGSLSRFRVLSIGPIEVIDDTYNANPASMTAALETLAERAVAGARIAALGEMLELGDAAAWCHREVGEAAGRLGVAHLFVKGPHAGEVIGAARANGVPDAQAMEEPDAIAQAIHAVAQPGDVLLVKGSRGMRMEQVIDAFRRHCA